MANAPLQEKSAYDFMKLCKKKFGWSYLNEEVIMDVGCGSNMACGKLLLQQYPDVRVIIAIDKDPQVMCSFRESPIRKIECAIADIEKRDTLSLYLEKMNKVVSTSVFHELTDIQSAFQNVYDLLRPGGEAALQFLTQSSTRRFLLEHHKPAECGDSCQDRFNDFFLNGMKKTQCMEMVDKIGFKVVDCTEKAIEKPYEPYESDEDCIEWFGDESSDAFKMIPEMMKELKKGTRKCYDKLSGRDGRGRLVYKSTEMNLLLLKPKQASVS